VREQGYAFDLEETTLLGNCIGVPLLDADGMAISASYGYAPQLAAQ
jgi:DNA-binding IclR family transcriptional regulator